MRVRTGGRRVEIPDERVRGGRGCETPYRASGSSREAAIHKTTSQRSELAPSPLYPYKSKLEAAFARSLEFDRLAGVIVGFGYELVRFKLPGEKNYYKIDFCVWGYKGEARPVFIEVKGRNRSDDRSLVKLKTAAGLNVWAKFLLIKYVRGTWVEREIHP